MSRVALLCQWINISEQKMCDKVTSKDSGSASYLMQWIEERMRKVGNFAVRVMKMG
jgi:hypothetical protein